MKAVAYLRTSSATNVGGDSDKRQRDAIAEWASRNGYEIEAEFYDAAVSGADHVMDRDAFPEMFEGICSLRLQSRVILVENASRFSRDLAVQIAGYETLRKSGITLIPVDSPQHFLEDTPTAVMVRNILGAVSQFEKDNLVAKLRKARERRKAEVGKCGGRKSYKEMHPGRVEEAKRLRRLKWTLKQIAEHFTSMAWLNEDERPYSHQAISAMIRQ
jgi:DNA invertase Pin-like site-specific DNA recombinase